ncbi:DUF2806 domain-containing protein [Paracidovorax konjaci]|uniref:DUF2806 domain-containing protein n=1 Tax=Paracidovorax konjaci TaxID=32040 RepID=A0A1I1Y0A4_9BURK|nr:DUF2806 domain-containing protein [Paracidovorax konjaci]SFE12981.1 Protein of unknown function [Paracidovorax konjaci]
MDFPGEKLVIKLWETLTEKGIGALLSPWQATREGRARNEVRRHEILILAQAETDAVDIRSGKKQLRPDGTLLLTGAAGIPPAAEERIEPTLAYSTMVEYGSRAAAAAVARSEINATKAILFAEEQLANDAQIPSDQNVDEDWLFVWREHAGKVSTEDLQRLWGSVLAGEVKTPGKYSIRTLDFLKALSKVEAEMIGKLASYVINGCIASGQMEYLISKGLSLSTLLQMQEIGVVSGVESLGLTRTYKSVVEGKFIRALVSHSKALVVEHEDASKTLDFDIYTLTAVGRQVLELGSFEPDIEYLRLVGKEFAKNGFSVKLADWQNLSETQGNYFNGIEIPGDDPPSEA